MRVFLTGAAGFVGSALIKELLGNGHEVLGLTRSDRSAERIAALGAAVHTGAIENLDVLQSGATACDAVVHLAFDSNYKNFAASCQADESAIRAIGEAIAGTGKPFIVPNGLAGLAPGRVVTEDDDIPADYAFPRRSEQTALELALSGVTSMVLRLAQVHGPDKQGLVTGLLEVAKETGVSAYVDDGANRWPAVHVADAVRLVRMMLETPQPNAKFHAVAEEGVEMRAIAEAIGRAADVPTRSLAGEDAERHFGSLAMFITQDMPAASDRSRAILRWRPVGPGLIEDIEQAGQ